MTLIPERRRMLMHLAEHWMYDYVNGDITADAFSRKLYTSMLEECIGYLKDKADEIPLASGTVALSTLLAVTANELEGLRP